MNAVWIHGGETLGKEITAILDSLGIPLYYVWRGVLRKDNEGESTRWDDQVFPGKNWAVQLMCDDKTLAALKEKLEAFLVDDYVRQTGVEMFVQRAERLI
ncbi:MAG: hypothetical protein GX310_00510 [Synergistaceae bacterium]|nr:hypothetical protein [Synergistaceae bacterium]